MLILGRRVGENVMIGHDIIVKVVGIHGGQIRLGIDAPKDVAVHREEVYKKIRDNEDKDK